MFEKRGVGWPFYPWPLSGVLWLSPAGARSWGWHITVELPSSGLNSNFTFHYVFLILCFDLEKKLLALASLLRSTSIGTFTFSSNREIYHESSSWIFYILRPREEEYLTTSGHLCFLSIDGGRVSLVTFPIWRLRVGWPAQRVRGSRGPRLPPVAERPQAETLVLAEPELDQGAEQRAGKGAEE